jgi:very-short-patch-repair endonuclease
VVHAQAATSDALVAKIATRQYGVIRFDQLLAAGLTREAVRWRAAVGRLHRLHRGVYAVGHRGIGAKGRWKAATLALGASAVLSHRSAAELWGLLPERGGYPHVTVPGNGGRDSRQGIRVHRSRSMTPSHATVREGIPVTTPGRTLADLRATIAPAELRRARRRAEFLGLPLAPDQRTDRTRSDLERDFLSLCRHAGIPAPEVNVRIGPYTVDFFWRESKLVVETDGYAAHRGWQSFQDDHIRDSHLARMGLDVLRFSDWQIDNRPEEAAATVRARLEREER